MSTETDNECNNVNKIEKYDGSGINTPYLDTVALTNKTRTELASLKSELASYERSLSLAELRAIKAENILRRLVRHAEDGVYLSYGHSIVEEASSLLKGGAD